MTREKMPIISVPGDPTLTSSRHLKIKPTVRGPRFYQQGPIVNSQEDLVYICSTNTEEAKLLDDKNFAKEMHNGSRFTRKHKEPDGNIRWEGWGGGVGVSKKINLAAKMLVNHGHHREGGNIPLRKRIIVSRIT